MDFSRISQIQQPLCRKKVPYTALGSTLAGTLVAIVLLSLSAGAETFQETTPPAPPAQQPAQVPVEHPASASIPGPAEATGAAPLRVMVGKSLLINTSERLKRVSVTDPGVADIDVDLTVHLRCRDYLTVFAILNGPGSSETSRFSANGANA